MALKSSSKLWLIFGGYFTVLAGAAWFSFSTFRQDILTEWAAIQASQTAQNHKLLRKYYAEKVVSVVKNKSDIPVDWGPNRDQVNTIPLPLTLWFEVAEAHQKDKSLIEYHIYSDYPFPPRGDRKLDEFQRNALSALVNGEQLYYELLGNTVRAAIPDHMTSEACTDCHNNLASSPKRDWKVGDLAGAIEVRLPIQSQLSALNSAFLSSFSIVVVAIFFITLFTLKYIFDLLKRENLLAKNLEQKNSLIALNKTLKGLAHNINTPLGVALMASSNLKSSNEIEEQAIDMTLSNLRKVSESVRLITLLSDSDEPSTFNVRQLIESCTSGLDFSSENINLCLDIQDIHVTFPRSVLTMSLINVFKNFSHAFNDKEEINRRVTIKTYKEGDFVKIEISDNGKGMKITDPDKLLMPFHTMSNRIQFGLAHSYCSITSCGGQLSIASEPDIYFKVTISIPYTKATPNSKEPIYSLRRSN